MPIMAPNLLQELILLGKVAMRMKHGHAWESEL